MLVLRGLRIWNGTSDALEPYRATLHIEGEWIEALGTTTSPDANDETIALDGATALPGLIDAHVDGNCR